MTLPILLPHQLQSHIFVTLQFLVHLLPVRRRVGANTCLFRNNPWIQPCFQPGLAEFRRWRPCQAAGYEPCQVLMHGALADQRATGDLTLPQLVVKMKAKNLMDLAHGHSLSGHVPSIGNPPGEMSNIVATVVLAISITLPARSLLLIAFKQES